MRASSRNTIHHRSNEEHRTPGANHLSKHGSGSAQEVSSTHRGKVPLGGLEAVPDPVPFDSSSSAGLTFLYLDCWEKKVLKSDHAV